MKSQLWHHSPPRRYPLTPLLLEEKCRVVSMWKSETDYRLVKSSESSKFSKDKMQRQVYFVGESSVSNFDNMFSELIKGNKISVNGYTSTADGRRVLVPKSSNNIAHFHFDDLCKKPTGASDYLAIAESFHTVFIRGIPKLNMNEINIVRRFIVFVE